MAAKRTIQYRGHTIRVWDKSYSIDNNPVVFVGDVPDVAEIKAAIDADIALNKIGLRRGSTGFEVDHEGYRFSNFDHRKPTWQCRLVDWFELKIGIGGDVHRQTFYAWRDYPDAMKLTTWAFFWLGALFATLAMIVGAWLLT